MNHSLAIPGWNGRPLSKMMLGTVQFGMTYGIANRTGQPDSAEVRAILKAALDAGVNALDTAAAYGSSEEILGQALADLGIANDLFVVTKVRPLTPLELADPSLAASAIENSALESSRKLRLDRLPGLLFHRESDAAYAHVLIDLKNRGLLLYPGVSCDNTPGPAASFAASGTVSALQIPGNILDRRHQLSGIFSLAQSSGVALFLRSIYLQGLLVMPQEQIPPHLSQIIPYRNQLQSLAEQAAITLSELALRYMLAQPGITSCLTGVETLQQVHDNLALFAKGPLSPDLLHAVDSLRLTPPDPILTPSLWNAPKS